MAAFTHTDAPQTTIWTAQHALREVIQPPSLRPAYARCRRLDHQHLARVRPLEHVLWTTPVGRHHEQRATVRAAERTREAPPVELDCLQDLAALSNAHTTLVGDVSVPDRVLPVEALSAALDELQQADRSLLLRRNGSASRRLKQLG